MPDGLATCVMIAAWLGGAGARAAHVRKHVIVVIAAESILNTRQGRHWVQRQKADAIHHRNVGMTLNSHIRSKLLVPRKVTDPHRYKLSQTWRRLSIYSLASPRPSAVIASITQANSLTRSS